MGGFFGGILGVLEPIGGLILYLLIGENAKSKTGGARFARDVFGGAFIGILLGVIIGGLFGLLIAVGNAATISVALGSMLAMGLGFGGLGFIFSFLVVVFLEMLRHALERGD